VFAAFLSSSIAFGPTLPAVATDTANVDTASATTSSAPVTSVAATSPPSSSGYNIGMDWNGSGSGGSTQWVPDPAIPSVRTETTGADTPSASNDATNQKMAEADETEAQAPTIDEFGSEITVEVGEGSSDDPKGNTGDAPPLKPFNYQEAADDLIASPSPPPLPVQSNKDENKPFDDSRFAMDNEDGDVVESLSFKLYDGRNNR